jgi:hypothetical protein
MKKLLFLFILSTSSLLTNAQERLSKAFIGAILHDFKSPGAGMVYSFGLNKYLGVGPGIDVSNYEIKSERDKGLKSVVASVYADVRAHIQVRNVQPFAAIQAGYPFYEQKGQFQNITPTYDGITRKGKFLYGGGVGIAHKKGKVGIFVSYIQRFYLFKYDPSNANINGRELKDVVDNSASVGVITAGITF